MQFLYPRQEMSESLNEGLAGCRKGEAAETRLDGSVDKVWGSQKVAGEGGTSEVSGWVVVSLSTPRNLVKDNVFVNMSILKFSGSACVKCSLVSWK